MCHVDTKLNQSGNPVRGIHGLTGPQAEIVLAAASRWTTMRFVERHDSYDGDTSVVACGEGGTTFIVDRDGAGIRVSCMCQDEFLPGECRFQSVMQALDELKRLACIAREPA